MVLSAAKFFFSVCFLVIFCSCRFLPEPGNERTHYYDLGIPERAQLAAGTRVTVLPFTVLSGERFRMVERKQFLLENDDCNKWQMPPGSLVTKYLTLYFRQNLSAPGKATRNIIVGGTVTAFENDGKNAILGLVYRITFPEIKGTKSTPVSRNILIEEKLLNGSPASFACAMSKAMGKAAQYIVKDIENK
ncbi:MAG: hypothetical protein J6S53_06055 [Lentisphaeria bacterium]|nr:hypothetical protein [Lentisphaeria bacterium]